MKGGDKAQGKAERKAKKKAYEANLRIHPGTLLGICAGAGTSPSGFSALKTEARSQVPALGYGLTYAIGNV
jgi:uncharacterized transporter YbjL